MIWYFIQGLYEIPYVCYGGKYKFCDDDIEKFVTK